MITVDEALKLVDNSIIPSNKKVVLPVLESLNYVLYEDVYSPINMPPFRQSAMDGYAVNIHDNNEYQVIDEVKAGDGHNPALKPGEAVRIFTGAAIPDTSNAVVIQENVKRTDDIIEVENSVSINDNIRPLGEQVKKGAVALKKGLKLNSAALGFLTSLGIIEVTVFKKPSIAIIVTGNELVKAGNTLPFGKIYESNSGMLLNAISNLGFNNISLHKVEDNYAKTISQLDELITNNDIVVITGGISVGDYDYVGKALLELDVNQIFYKVKQKPGKPLFFGKKSNTIIFALPGNPAAALSCTYLYVNSALQKMSGNLNYSLVKIKAKSTVSYKKVGVRAQFLKAIYQNNKATILEGQSSAMLQTFALANALVYVPEDLYEINVNDEIEVICLPI